MSFIWQGKEQTHDTSPNSDLCPNFSFSQWSHLFYDAGLSLISHYLKIKMNTTLVYSSSIRMINFKNVNEVLSWTAGRGSHFYATMTLVVKWALSGGECDSDITLEG